MGVVGIIGIAEGGRPLSVDPETNDFTSPDALGQAFRSGDLRTAGLFAFEPSADEAIPGGAQRVVAVKVNPSTKSSAQLADGAGQPSIDLESADWGQFTEQINVDVQTGTLKGKLLSVVFEDIAEVFDDVGGDPLFDVIYAPGAEGYDTLTGALSASGFVAAATKAVPGLLTEVTDATPAGFPSVASIVSSNAADATQSITLYGVDTSGKAQREVVALNGSTAVQGALAWSKILGATLSAACLGTVTVSDFPVANTAITIAPGTVARGVVLTTNTPAGGAATVSIDTNAAVDVAIFGEAPSGAATGEVFDMTAGTTPVPGVVVMRSISVIALGEAAAARTVTVATNAETASAGTFKTVQQLVDRLNTLGGFTANAQATNALAYLITRGDYAPAASLMGAAAEFYGDIDAVVSLLNRNSQFVVAKRAAGAVAGPADLATPTFLQGGGEGTPTITDWQEAFALLKKRRVTTIVPLSNDGAVQNLLLTHLIARAGKLRSEANGYIGLGDVDGRGETLANIRTRIAQINSRHISAIAEEVQRYDPITGEATWYPPYMYAAIAAGMQAGSAIGEPLTRKLPLVLDVRNDSSWSAEETDELLIDSGLMFSAREDNVGISWVRSLTTHLQDDNIHFIEMSANESLITAIYRFRSAMDKRIGARALASSLGALKGLASDELNRLVTDEIIVEWRALSIEQVGDMFPTSVEIAPIDPVNFIPIVVHLSVFRAA